MTLLLAERGWAERRALPGDLAALADGMAQDLEPVLARPLFIPDEKALMSREGGRCPRDGTLLEFDPFEPDRHQCGTCGGVYDGPWHRGLWYYWYHLWLAERAVHAAVLYRLRGNGRHAAFATRVLEGYADRYLSYPNRDNVLGPTRPFFSTYLESIWLLQLCIALDTLEGADPQSHRPLGVRVRDALVEPSVALIASYDERLSNRQVWNVAAQIAALRILGRTDDVARIVESGHGLEYLLRHAMFEDGTWYEGENYHMFAHRGLWYGVTMAEAAGLTLPRELAARFERGFVAPFLTALPDMTLPSRRDSQYAISLRQPRFAEPCELGLTRSDDPRLAGILATLYADDPELPLRNNGWARTAADVERNLPAMRLSRRDLGWRALLFAKPELPDVAPSLPGSVVLEGQGIAVLRRERGRVYAALDYGHTGGGHGHPDRLNLLLVDRGTRLLDDFGTGSYVERALHWYRSSLAHNAPLVDGHSQRRVDGELLAWEDRGGAGWVKARVAGIAPGVVATRTIVMMPGYLVDELRWTAEREITLDLPFHAPLRADAADWRPAALTGGGDLEDGFDFIADASCRDAAPGEAMRFAQAAGAPAAAHRAIIAADQPSEWWQLRAPGAPGSGMHTFHLLRVQGAGGRIRAVWAWSEDVARDVAFMDDATIVLHADALVDTHRETDAGWHVDLAAGPARSSIDLAGRRRPSVAADASAPAEPDGDDRDVPTLFPAASPVGQGADHLAWALGEEHYRRSEVTWQEAGAPAAAVRTWWDGRRLHVEADVAKHAPLVFVPAGAENPLDNEVPEINGDGVQLYVLTDDDRSGGWTIVPVERDRAARAVPSRGWGGLELVRMTWSRTADGYRLAAEVDLGPPEDEEMIVGIGVIVNETVPGRSRRRGQLVLGGAAGEWVYLRGDRHDPERLLPIRLLSGELY